MFLGSLRKSLRSLKIFQPLRLLRLGYEARHSGHTNWAPLLQKHEYEWEAAKAKATGQRVLIATNVGLNFAVSRIDTLVAISLVLRGAQVEFLMCDGALPSCMAANSSWFQDDHIKFEKEGLSKSLCKHCHPPALHRLAAIGLKVHRLGTYLEPQDDGEIETWLEKQNLANVRNIIVDGVPIGEHALSGTLRYLACGTLKEEHYPMLRSFLRSARKTQIAVSRLAGAHKFDSALLHHGIYVPQGTTAAVLRQNGVNISTWLPTYRKNCFIFSHEDTYHRTMVTEPTDVWENLELTPAQHDQISHYLKSRWTGENDWISFHRTPKFDFKAFADERGIDTSKPIIGLLTNVFWDAQLHYPENGFSSMREWLTETVRYFATRPDLQLVIRVHPAEVTGAMPAKETAVDILREDIGDLPANVFVVRPEETISTYTLSSYCSACIIYATKAGIELLSMNIPVIAAGEAWVKGKNMSLDAEDWETYKGILDKLPEISPPAGFRERAFKYAYHFFFRRMIPLNMVRSIPSWPPYETDVQSLRELQPGADRGMDVICSGIMNGDAFIYPAEAMDIGLDGK